MEQQPELNNIDAESNDVLTSLQMPGSEENKGSVRVVSGSGFRYVVPFPWRLHQMLEEVEKSGEDTIASWLQDGEHFLVHNPQAFVQKIIPKFFKQKSYKSFQRQLHLYGFQRVLEGPNRGAYFHECFLKKDRKLALDITRIKAPKRRRPPPQKSMLKASPNDMTSLRTAVSSALQPVTSEAPMIKETNASTMENQFKPFGNTQHNFSVAGQTTTSESLDLVSAFNPSGNYRLSNGGLFVPRSSAHLRRESSDSSASASNTREWLVNAGVPLSMFDPVAFDNQASQPPAAADLIECANEIRDLFCPPPVTSSAGNVQQFEQCAPSLNQRDTSSIDVNSSFNDTSYDFGDLSSFEFF